MNKLILLIFCGLTMGTGLWADPASNAKGVMILTSASGIDPRNVLFTDQVWASFDGGTVTDTDGQKSSFLKRDIGKIIYFDSNFYSQLDNDQQEKAFRAGIQAREVVVNTSFLNLDTSTGLKTVQDSESTLESLVHDYPAIQSLVQPQINLLKDDITKLSTGQNLQDGTWLAQGQAAPQGPPTIGGGPRTLTFTTKDGQKYVNARVDVTDTGISVLTSDGGTTIPFDQLPDDLSGFPESVRKLVDQKHQAAVAVASYSTPPASTPIPPSARASTDTPSDSAVSVKAMADAAQEPLTSDVEEARSFVEHHLADDIASTAYKLQNKVRIEKSTGQIIVLRGVRVQDCLLGSLDLDSIVYKSTDDPSDPSGNHVIVYTKDHERTVSESFRSADGALSTPTYSDHIDLDNINQPDRVAKALSLLVSSYSSITTDAKQTADVNDLREKLCKELRSALSAQNDIQKAEVSYDRAMETVTWKISAPGSYSTDFVIEIDIPIKKVDPQAINWEKSDVNPSNLKITMIDDEKVIQKVYLPASDNLKDLRNFILIAFPTEKDAADFADTITQLCKELGWQPSKF